MKRLRLENEDGIKAAISEAEGRSTTRTLTYGDIVNGVRRWENNAFSPSSAVLRDCTLLIQASAAHFAKAYKYTPYETVCELRHDTIGWYVERITRKPVRSHNWTVTATITERARNYILYEALTA